MEATTYLFLIVAGFFAGLVDSMAGGGGLISLPALVAAGVPPHIALGTNKLQSCLGTMVGTSRFLKRGLIVLPVALPAAILSALGSLAGSRTALALSSEHLMALIPPLIVLVGLITFLRRGFGNEDHFGAASAKEIFLASAIGFVIGFYDGFFGPGTGSFLVFLFVALLHFGFLRANAAAKLVNLGSNVAALISFALAGKILLVAGLAMAAANIAGNLVGAGLAIRKGSALIKPVFGLVLAALLVKIVFFS
jgi:uncharacterized membrane protein YfcA